jgi:hypothetical protein
MIKGGALSMKNKLILSGCLTIGICILGIGLVCQSSTPEAWKEFRQAVNNACWNQVKDSMMDPDISVDPLGSESFGIAIAHGVSKETHEEILRVTIYNKQTHKAETGFGFSEEDIGWLKRLLDENQKLKKELSELKAKK